MRTGYRREISHSPNHLDLSPNVSLDTLKPGIYRDTAGETPYYAIVDPPGGFSHGLDSRGFQYIGIGTFGCGAISGDTLGRWEWVPDGTKISIEFTARKGW
jgi:hypothetical protein